MGGPLDNPFWARAAAVAVGAVGALIGYGIVVFMPVGAVIVVLALAVVLVLRRRKSRQQILLPFTVGFGAMLVLYAVLAVIAVVSSPAAAGSVP